MRAYHLSGEWGLTAIRNRRLKIARFNELNDPFELLPANLKDKDKRAAFKQWKPEISDKFGVLCFSESWESPLLWSHYGSKHRGLCLGFDLPDEKVLTVEYQKRRIDLEDAPLTEATIKQLLSTKYTDWSYERECRVITNLSEKDSEGNYYADFGPELTLREVIVGSLCNVSRDQLEAEISGAGLDLKRIGLSKARLAFKSFAIVPDKRGLR